MDDTIVFVLGGRPMSIAVYYRCSTNKQDLDHQRLAVQQWVKQQGYENESIQEYADEAVSGAKGADLRLGFAELIDAIKKRTITKCILFESSRASRDFMQLMNFLDLCSKSSCEVEVVGDGVQAFNTSTDKFMASVQAFLAQAEREKISQRTKSGMAKAKANGVKMGAPRGHKRNVGWRKDHPKALLAAIKKLTEKGLSQREIAEIIGDKYTSKPINYGTIRNLQKRYGIAKPGETG